MNWINVKDALPKHQDIILVCSRKGIGVATFVDSIKMNEELRKTSYANECVDVDKHPYYFVSQEIRQHTFNDVTHWMHLPKKPY
jgi:hypothetical protein